MNKLSIIIPIHTTNEEVLTHLTKCFEALDKQSVKDFDVLIASFGKCKEDILNANTVSLDLEFIDLPKALDEIYPNYSQIVNFAVQSPKIKTPYFTILQFDDILNNTYVKNFIDYSNSYPLTSIFMPIVLEFNGTEFTRSINEVVWSFGFTGKEGRQGYLDFNTLKQFNIFSFASAIYKTEDFILEGGFKNSIKKYFEYEYFLRILYKTYEVMIIPKFMVRHTINRETSLSSEYDKMEKLEDKFYLDLAKKEYFFDEDRNITYNTSQ